MLTLVAGGLTTHLASMGTMAISSPRVRPAKTVAFTALLKAGRVRFEQR